MDLLHQFREKISFSFNEKKYKEIIEYTASSITDLSRIVNQRSSEAIPTAYLSRTAEIPQEFSHINKASKSLHSCLAKVWSCSNSSHSGHKAQLSVNAKCNPGVRLDLVLSARQKNVAPTARYVCTSASKACEI